MRSCLGTLHSNCSQCVINAHSSRYTHLQVMVSSSPDDVHRECYIHMWSTVGVRRKKEQGLSGGGSDLTLIQLHSSNLDLVLYLKHLKSFSHYSYTITHIATNRSVGV